VGDIVGDIVGEPVDIVGEPVVIVGEAVVVIVGEAIEFVVIIVGATPGAEKFLV